MIYLVAQIFICLLLAALIGYAIGWIVRGFGFRKQIATIEETWKERLSAAQRNRDRWRAEAEHAVEHTNALKENLQHARASRSESSDLITKLEGLIPALAKQLEAWQMHRNAPEDDSAGPPPKINGSTSGTRRAPSGMPAWYLPTPDGRPDDLKQISGVGPVLERRLNGLGIFHFRQIAAFTPADVRWVDGHLDELHGRIVRDRWVEQAREMILPSRHPDPVKERG